MEIKDTNKTTGQYGIKQHGMGWGYHVWAVKKDHLKRWYWSKNKIIEINSQLPNYKKAERHEGEHLKIFLI